MQKNTAIFISSDEEARKYSLAESQLRCVWRSLRQENIRQFILSFSKRSYSFKWKPIYISFRDLSCLSCRTLLTPLFVQCTSCAKQQELCKAGGVRAQMSSAPLLNAVTCQQRNISMAKGQTTWLSVNLKEQACSNSWCFVTITEYELKIWL